MEFIVKMNAQETISTIHAGTLKAFIESMAEPEETVNEPESEQETLVETDPTGYMPPQAEPLAPEQQETLEEVPESPKTLIVTREDVRAVLADAAKRGKRTMIKKLFQEFGANKLPEIKDDDLSALMAKAKEL